MLAIIAPGQGSQTPGMLNSWIADPSLKELLISWSDAIGLDLVHLGTVADADEIKDTANAQPLIVATSLLGAHALGIKQFDVTSGHSVGELAAAALSGAISEADALTIVRARGIEMAKAAAASPSGMSALLGGDRAEVLAAIAALNLVAANDNGAGQIVAAGDLQALASLNENPPSGARVRALAVAGAFHTQYMQSAVEPLASLASTIETRPVSIEVISNKDTEALLEKMVEERLAKVKANLDKAYSERDEALKRAVQLEEERKQQKLAALEAEGKHKEVAEMKLTELQEKLRIAEERNIKLTRDAAVRDALTGLDFRNERSQQMAYRDVVEQDAEYDIDLEEFSDEIEPWIIDEFKKIGCDTALSVLNLSVEELVRRTDLEEETIVEVHSILNAEFEDE